jgi:hypothetical protein
VREWQDFSTISSRSAWGSRFDLRGDQDAGIIALGVNVAVVISARRSDREAFR